MNRRSARELWTKQAEPWEYKGNFDDSVHPRDRQFSATMLAAAPDRTLDAEFVPVAQKGFEAHIYQRDYDDYMAGDEATKERMRLYQGIDDKTMVSLLSTKRKEARDEFHRRLFAYHDEEHELREEAAEAQKTRKRAIRDAWLPAATNEYALNMDNARFGPDGRHEVFGDFREDRRQDFRKKQRALLVDPEDYELFEEMDQSQ
jgi:hypothetical protein